MSVLFGWPGPSLILALCVFGCGGSPDGSQTDEFQARSAEPAAAEPKGLRARTTEPPMKTEVPSADSLLSADDSRKFRPGASKNDILSAIHWRGNFEMATEDQGKRIEAISYAVIGRNGAIGDSVWAIFVDDEFVKFVAWPDWGDKRTLKIGDFRLLVLVQAFESEPLNVADLAEANRAEPHVPAQTDPGLTAAWLRLRKSVQAAQQRDLERNAALRDQFNASRLRIGMTILEVESVLQAKPIEVGIVEAGSFHIYGATDSLNAMPVLHYSNILVLFRNGRVTGIYAGSTVPGGRHGLEEMRQWFPELRSDPGKELP